MERLASLLQDSVDIHKRSDVPIGGYLSGGLDSSIVSCLATREGGGNFAGFNGKFSLSSKYDESHYARAVADERGFELHVADITLRDFLDNIRRVFTTSIPGRGPVCSAIYGAPGKASQGRPGRAGGMKFLAAART